MSETPRRLLVIEDNQPDVILLKLALEQHGIPYVLHVLDDGASAADYIANGASESLPELVIVDLNLPRIDGFDVVAGIRNNHAFDSIPVMVLTTSESRAERERATSLGVQAFIHKPLDLEGFLEVGKVIAGLLAR